MTWDIDQMHLIKEDVVTEFADDFIIPGWTKRGFTEKITSLYDKKYKKTFSMLSIKIKINRAS